MTETTHPADELPKVVVVGGGIAGLETVLALHHLAPELADVTLVSPEPDFLYKPMMVNEPFSSEPAARHDLAGALSSLEASFVQGALSAVGPEAHEIELVDSSRLSYDMLMLAVGGRARPAYARCETFWAGRSDLEIDRMLDAAGESASHALTFIAPPGCTWPLPLYELALMTRRRSEERGPYGVLLRVITAEAAPLGAFGPVASDAVATLLRARAIEVIANANVVEEPAGLRMIPGGGLLEDGPMIALPNIVGAAVNGLPATDAGFIPIDLHGRVRGVEDVYAAGDGTDFPVKQGGIATQQADAAAEHMAARLGASVEPAEFDPVLRGQLITGGESLNLKHELAGGRGEGGASLDYLWWPPGKVAGRYLAPWLAGTTLDESLEPPAHPLEVEVSLPHEWHGAPLGL